MYNNPLYRPPSEATSAIIQATLGCSHNNCIFCNMYKTKEFKIFNKIKISEHVKQIANLYPMAEKVFVADGNAFVMPTNNWLKLLADIKSSFPNCGRISTYANPKDILKKNNQELEILRQNGLKLLYMGIESGSNRVLDFINKGVESSEIILAGKRAISAGFELSVTIIAGIGGENYVEHAVATANIINEIQPQYVGLLSLMLEPFTRLHEKAEKGEFNLPSSITLLKEIKIFLTNIDLQNTIFRSNHASNYLTLAGTLNRDRLTLLKKIDFAMDNPHLLRSEWNRGL